MALCAAVGAFAFAAVLPGVGAAASSTKRESYSKFVSQVSRGEVRTAVLTPKKGSLRARLKRGGRVSVKYPIKDDRALVKQLHANHVHVAFASPAKHHSHGLRRRYIVLIVVGVAALLVFAAWRVVRRRPDPGAELPASPPGANL